MTHRESRSILTTLTSRSGATTLEKRGVSRWDLTDPYHFALTLTWAQFFAVLVLSYLALNALFASAYLMLPGSISNLPAGSPSAAFFFSVETLATVGYGTMAPATFSGHVVASLEVFVGMMFTATMTGLAFVRLSKAKAKILFAEKIVIAEHNGVACLMIRIGNGRAYALTNAFANVIALVSQEDSEGQKFMNGVDLKLRRHAMPFFPLTWTLMHELEADSPLFGLSEATTSSFNLHLMLTIVAHDPALGAEVSAAQNYYLGDVAFGMRYADAVSSGLGGFSVADMRQISSVETA